MFKRKLFNLKFPPCLSFLFFMSISFLFSGTIKAQSWQWAKSGGSNIQFNRKEEIKSMVTDSEGNVYFITVVNNNGLLIDGSPTTTYGSKDAILVSYTCDGAFRWSQTIGSNGSDDIRTIQIDDQDNLYLSCFLARTSILHLGSSTTLPYSTQNDEHKERVFLLKFDNLGNLLWYQTPQNNNYHQTSVSDTGKALILDLQTDPLGNSYWLCLLGPGSYANGNYINTTSYQYSYVILNYDANGNFIEGFPLDMDADVYYPNLNMVRNHTTETIYLGGYLVYGDEYFFAGGDTVSNRMFLLAFDDTGDFLWKKGNTSYMHGAIEDLVLDEEENIYITGGTSIQLNTLTPDTFSNTVLTSPFIGTFPFVMKLDEDGNTIWSTNGSTKSSAMRSYGIAVNNNEVAITAGHGKLYWEDDSLMVVTNQRYDIMIGVFNRHNGDLINLDKLLGDFGYSDYARVIRADNLGNFYIGGYFGHYVYLNNNTLVNDGQGYDYILAKYGSNSCNCDLPEPSFTYNYANNSTSNINFTYDGTPNYDDLIWDFGNGDSSLLANPNYSFDSTGTHLVCVTVTDECGTNKYCEFINATLGLNNLQNHYLNIYQNPNEHILSIISSTELNYSLYSILGKKITQGQLINGHSKIPTDQLESGCYILEVTNNNGKSKSTKVIINNK